MKIENIKFTAQAVNGDYMVTRFFATEKAMSKWANHEFFKDENITVTVWEGFGTDKVYCTYHA